MRQVQEKIKKIVVMGTTGSGKTTFLRNIVGEFDGAEVDRNLSLEEEQQLNTFTIIDKKLHEKSTTTTSMNVKNVLFYTTFSNQFSFTSPITTIFLQDEMIDLLYPTMIVDVAGQERFNFMVDICLPGANGCVIFADGTNVQSLERVEHFINLIRKEEKRSNTEIPMIVMVNKLDLKEKGFFVGVQHLRNTIPPANLKNVSLFETTNFDMETMLLPVRALLSFYDDLPVEASGLR